MKYKYILNPGLAFKEDSFIEKLNRNATEGWLIEGFVTGGFFFKLKKGQPTNQIYCIDSRKKPDEEYFQIFEIASWKHIYSYGEMLHFFQAPKGTPPIYTDPITAKDKHADMLVLTKNGAIISGIVLLLSILTQLMTFDTLPLLYGIGFFTGLISLFVFIFCFMPWVGYKFKNR